MGSWKSDGCTTHGFTKKEKEPGVFHLTLQIRFVYNQASLSTLWCLKIERLQQIASIAVGTELFGQVDIKMWSSDFGNIVKMKLSNVDQFNNIVWVSLFSWTTLPSEAIIITIMVLKSKGSFAFALLFLTCFAHTVCSTYNTFNATNEILSVLDCLDSIYLSQLEVIVQETKCSNQ